MILADPSKSMCLSFGPQVRYRSSRGATSRKPCATGSESESAMTREPKFGSSGQV
jgi:hypothetical protein